MGYIGLPTGTLFADAGHEVVGVDVSVRVIESINASRAHFGEPRLDEILATVVATGRLRATLSPEQADAFILAVPTPFKDNHKPDLKYVEQATEMIAPFVAAGNLVVLESTSPVGATEFVRDLLGAARPDLSLPGRLVGDQPLVNLAYCPERVLPGRILDELVSNARVIGGLTPDCADRAARLYQAFVKGECRTTDARTAEMAKLTENSFRDVNIAFANELSLICDRLGIDIWELISIANLHPRVKILEPGCGVGGHCIAVDPWFIVNKTPEEARLIRTAREVNDGKPHFVLSKIRQALVELPKPATIACFGLAFKPDIEDLRESPAIEIVETLGQERCGKILVVEPHISKLPVKLASWGALLTDTASAIRDANILVFLVDHVEFRALRKESLGGKPVIDPRGIWRSTSKPSST